MRTEVPALLPLFRSELQMRLLALLLEDPAHEWMMRDLQERSGGTRASVHRELQRGVRAGILERRIDGRNVLYKASDQSPLFDPLRVLLERTVGVEPELRQALQQIRGIDAAAIHGSFAGDSRAARDIDVLVVGDPSYAELRKTIRGIERRLGRPIDVVVYSRKEFDDLWKRRNSFVHGVAGGPRVDIIGDLAALTS